MPSILVTGGAGYIGSHTCKALAMAGHTPVVLDNFSTGHRWAVRWGPLVEGDINDRALVRGTLEKFAIDSVIHFAANASVGESIVNPYRYLHDNASGSLSILEAMREAGARRIVFSSTCATYGIPGRVPISEAEPQRPINPYGESKLFVEKSLAWYETCHGVAWAALRYFNAAGADREGELGECHEPESHLVPLVVQAALGTAPPLPIMGVDYPTPDGTCVRDYIHVEDLADAHLRALDYLTGGGASVALNLGSAHGYSVREVVRAVERAGGCPVPLREAERRPGDPPALVADNRRALETLSWSPLHSDLDTIVGTAWRWHSSRDRQGNPIEAKPA